MLKDLSRDVKNMCLHERNVDDVVENKPENVATDSSGRNEGNSRCEAFHFSNLGGPKFLAMNESVARPTQRQGERTKQTDTQTDTHTQTIPTDEITEAFKLTLMVLYEKLKHLGRISVVFTQSKPDSWHEKQRLANNRVSDLDAHQWIVWGVGTDRIVEAKAHNSVCRHNLQPREVLTIPSVQDDSRTADSWYAKNGLQAYCGMRLSALPECSLCVLWVVDPPDRCVFDEAERVLSELFDSIDSIATTMVRKLVNTAALSDAQNKNAELVKQRQYITHELQNQLVPLKMLLEAGMEMEKELLSNTLNTMCSILKNPSEVALSLTPQPEYTNSFKWFENLCQFSKQIVRRPEVEFTFAYESEEAKEVELLIDPSKLRQMVVNIISNAKKFTKSGSIHFSMCATDLSPAGLVNEMDVMLKVADTGRGISKDNIHRVTELFVQAGPPESRGEGIGMGLAVAKTIAESIHGGKLCIDSTVGEGTTVSVTFRCRSRLLPATASREKY